MLTVTQVFPFAVPPSIVQISGDGRVTVTEGTVLDLICNTTGNPKPRVTWSKDGAKLHPSATTWTKDSLIQKESGGNWKTDGSNQLAQGSAGTCGHGCFR